MAEDFVQNLSSKKKTSTFRTEREPFKVSSMDKSRSFENFSRPSSRSKSGTHPLGIRTDGCTKSKYVGQIRRMVSSVAHSPGTYYE